MSTQQVFYVVGAVILFGVLLLPAKRASINRDQIMISSEATMTATAVGQELIEEIYDRKFDENLGPGIKDSSVNQLSTTMGLETAKGDTAGKLNTYDDIDDFNGYTRTVPTPRLGNFVDSVKVYYVTEDQPDVIAGSKQWLKRIDVKVRNQYIISSDSTVTVSKIIAYRYR